MDKSLVKLGIVSSGLVLVIAFCLVAYKKVFAKPDLTIIGVVNMADGLGRQSVELIDTLYKEMRIGFVPTALSCYKSVPKPVKKIIKNQYRPFGDIILFEECIWTPEKEHYKLLRTPKNDDQIRLAYTMFESSEIPAEWVEILNNYFDAAVVPDHYHIKVYQNCGVHIPIFLLPLGLNLQPFLQQEIKKRPHYPIVFGNFGACLNRKNQKLLVEAFHQAFGNTDQVLLRINSRYAQESTAQEIKEVIAHKEMRNVIFTQKSLNAEEYLEAFQSIDCLVSIATAEGFSIQPREAMALGIPVIVSDSSAQATICRSGLAKSVRAIVQQPAMRAWGTILKEPVQYGYEYSCTKEAVVEALLDMYDNYDYYLAKAEERRNWARKYDYSEIKSLYLALVKPEEIVLSTQNKITEHVLYTNSKLLYDKYQNLLKKRKA
jgi:glycosyltransferase involved in cell wall biosynthesis